MANDDGDLSQANSSSRLRVFETYLKVTEKTSLNLRSNLGIEEIKCILGLLSNSPIIKLNVEGNNFRGKMEELSELLVQTQLTALSLKQCQMSVNDFLHLIETLKDTRITDLSISGNVIKLDENATDEVIPHFSKSHLTALNLQCITIPQDRSVLLTKALMSASITHLNLCGVFRDHESDGAIGALFSSLKHSAIKVLNLSCNKIRPADLEDLGGSLRDSQLEELDLGYNYIEDTGVNYLFEALKHSKVVVLKLKHNEIRGRNSLGLHVKITQVKNLDLGYNIFRETEMFSFPDFLRGSAVESLNLYCCALRDEVAEQIIESLKLSRVTSLNLAFNYFSSHTIYKLCELLVCGNIVSIDISYNSFDNDAICALGDCLKASKLKTIEMSGLNSNYRG